MLPSMWKPLEHSNNSKLRGERIISNNIIYLESRSGFLCCRDSIVGMMHKHTQWLQIGRKLLSLMKCNSQLPTTMHPDAVEAWDKNPSRLFNLLVTHFNCLLYEGTSRTKVYCHVCVWFGSRCSIRSVGTEYVLDRKHDWCVNDCATKKPDSV